MAYETRTLLALEQQKSNWEELEDKLRAAQYGDDDVDIKLSLAECLARCIQFRVTVTRHIRHIEHHGTG